jgi:primosomal protein N''
MRNRFLAIAMVSMIALTALVPTAGAGARARRAAAALVRADAALLEISGHENAGALGAELTVAKSLLDDARAALRSGHDKRAEVLAERLDAQIALLRGMLSAAGVEARADAAELSVKALADRIRELEARYDALVLEARGAELTAAFPQKQEAAVAP